jgi:hypothetical protein
MRNYTALKGRFEHGTANLVLEGFFGLPNCLRHDESVSSAGTRSLATCFKYSRDAAA